MAYRDDHSLTKLGRKVHSFVTRPSYSMPMEVVKSIYVPGSPAAMANEGDTLWQMTFMRGR